jgi:hypothetical protein
METILLYLLLKKQTHHIEHDTGFVLIQVVQLHVGYVFSWAVIRHVNNKYFKGR